MTNDESLSEVRRRHRPAPPEPIPAANSPSVSYIKPKPETSYGTIFGNDDALTFKYGFHFTWRHYAGLWIVLDVIMVAFAIWKGISPQ